MVADVHVDTGWEHLLNDNQKKILHGAIEYAKDPYPDPGSNLKILIAEMAKMLYVHEEGGNGLIKDDNGLLTSYSLWE